MKHLLILLTVFALNLAGESLAQVSQQWLQRYDGPNQLNDAGQCVSVDDSGNVYVAGFTRYGNPSISQSDIILIKYNSLGVLQWTRVYGGVDSANDAPVDMAIDNSGNICVTGRVNSSATGTDIVTFKYSPAGALLWMKQYDGGINGTDWPYSLTVDNSNNILLAGRTSTGSFGNDCLIIKYNSSGDTVWTKRYNGSGNGNDEYREITIDGSGNVYVSGSTISTGNNQDALVAKYSSEGTQLWLQVYNSSFNLGETLNNIDLDNSGNVYACGGMTSSATNGDFLTLKYNNAGVFQWARRYDGPINNSSDYCADIDTDASGNVFVTGFSERLAIGNQDALTIKYNSNGDSLWVAGYNGIGNNQLPRRLIVDNSGSIYVCTLDFRTGLGYDYAVIKYSNSGSQLWVQQYNNIPNGYDDPQDMAIDNSGNIYITGASDQNTTTNGDDISTIKYSQLVGITPVSNQIPEKFSLSQNYPNPFNPTTKIKFEIPFSSFEGGRGMTHLIIYDLLGREVETLVNQNLNPGTYEVTFDAGKYTSGVYYYKLITGDYADTKKMVLIK